MIRRLQLLSSIFLLTFLFGWSVSAEPTSDADPFQGLLFSPEEVMQHQSAIGLTGEQRKQLVTEITQAQADLVPYQMEMAQFGETLMRRLAEPEIDEDAALGAATRIIELESMVKQRHLRLAIRIKNLLNAEQKTLLEDLRSQ